MKRPAYSLNSFSPDDVDVCFGSKATSRYKESAAERTDDAQISSHDWPTQDSNKSVR